MLEEIKKLFMEFEENATKAETGNKAAAQRARTISSRISHIFKDYRKESLAKTKGAK